MSSGASRVDELAGQILARELAGRATAADAARGIEAVFHRLHGLVAALVGHVGFGAIMARAVHLTSRSCSCFAEVDIRYGATLTMHGLVPAIEQAGAPAVGLCAATLLGNVLGLLSSFIGEDLTLRIIRRGWTGLADGGAGGDPEEPRS